MAEKRKAGEEDQQAKKLKFDENDIDFLIGDLLKEEAQLVLTRLLRNPETANEIRKNIDHIRQSRTKLSEQQIKQQLQQISQLRALQELTSLGAAAGAQFDFGMFPGGGRPGASGAGGASVDASIIRAIRAKIRDAFKKTPASRKGNDVYRVEEGPLTNEIANAKEKAEAGNVRPALEILQAITEEFLERSSHFEESNVENYSSVEEQIGKSWIQIFFGESVEGETVLSSEERDSWAEKLRSWNKSAEEESILNAARWAAKLGWQDPKIQTVLQGEGRAEFKEPMRLSLERLIVLEAGKHLQKALNLAKALSLHHHVARLLMKLGQPKDAVEAAKRLISASEVAAIAQVARPIDLDSAFNLAVYCISLRDTSKLNEMSNWLCDLAISENKLDDLVQQIYDVVKNMNTRMHMIRLLKSKSQSQTALKLGFLTLKPYTMEELIALWHLQFPQLSNTKPEDVVLPPKTIKELLNVIPGAMTPSDLPQFLYETGFELDFALSFPEKPTKFAEESLDKCLELVDQVHILIQLMKVIEGRKQYSSVFKVGKFTLEKIIEQEKIDIEYQKEYTTEFWKYEQEKALILAKGEIAPPFVAPIIHHYQYNFADSKLQVCRAMITSSLRAKEVYQPVLNFGFGAPAPLQISEEEKATKIQECDKELAAIAELCSAKIQNPDHLITIANDFINRQEFRLSLKIGQKAFSQVEEIDKERQAREALHSEYNSLKQENDLLVRQKLSLPHDKAEKLKQLSLDVQLSSNLPPWITHATVQSCGELFQKIATLNVTTAINSQNSASLPQRLSQQEVSDIVDHSLKFVRNPSNMVNLVNICRQQSEFALVRKIGKLTQERVVELRERVLQRLKIRIEIDALTTEQNNLRNLKKELELDQKTRLDALTEQQKQFVAEFYELNSVPEYDQLEYSVIESILSSAIDERQTLERNLNNLAPETPKEKIEKMKSDLEETKKRIPNIFEECMKALVYPSFTQRLANALNNKGEYELTIKASEACLVLIPNLVQKAKDKYEIQRDLNEIEEEFRELQSLKPPQQLSPEKIQKRRELSLILEFNRIQSSDMTLTPLQLIEYYSSVPSLMFTSLQNQQQTRIQKLDQIVHFISTPFDNISETAIAVHQAAIQSKKEEKLEIESQLPKLAQEKERIVKHCLQVLENNPKFWNTFASKMDLIDESTIDLFSQNARFFVQVIQKADEERVAHSPTIEKFNLLQQESLLLNQYRKKLSEEKAAELKALQRENDRWNFIAPRFDGDKLSNMIQEIYSNAFQLLKNTLTQEENLLKKVEEEQLKFPLDPSLKTPNNDVDQIKSRIEKLTDSIESFLSNFLQITQNPQHIQNTTSYFFKDIESLYKLTNRGIERIKEINTIYLERRPILQELKALQEQVQELADVNKQLKQNEQERLDELLHQKFVWDQEPSFFRVAPETRESIKYHLIESVENTLVQVKEDIQNAIDTLVEEEREYQNNDKMQVDGQTRDFKAEKEKLEKDLQVHNDRMKRIIHEYVDVLVDPNHFLNLANLLHKSQEYDLVVEVGKKGQNLVIKLNTERQEHAEIFKAFYLLLFEQYDKKRNNTNMHATRHQLLKEYEAKAKAIVPIPYVSKKGDNFGYPTQQDFEHVAVYIDSTDVKVNEDPSDWSTNLNHILLENLIGKLSLLMVQSISDQKQDFEDELLELESKGLKDADKADSPEIVAKREGLEKKLEELTKYVMELITDFTNHQKLLEKAQKEEHYQLILKIGEKVVQQVDKFRQEVIENGESTRELAKLRQESNRLQNLRSSLSEQEELRLLELQFQQNLRAVKPSYQVLDPSKYNRIVNDVFSSLLDIAYNKKQEHEKTFNEMANAPRLVRGASLSVSEIKEKAKIGIEKIDEDIDHIIKLIKTYVIELSNIVTLTEKLNDPFRDFKRLIVLGTKTQENLKAQLEIQERLETLVKQRGELEAKQIAGTAPSDELLNVIAEIEELQVKANYGSVQLRQWILDIAELMIDSARIEKDDKVVLDQIILVFKMTMTHDKFEEVKNLTDPKDWPAIRQDLLDYVAKQDTSLPGAAITLKTQIELLLREGLCTESINIFPDPEVDNYVNSQRIEILELLWFEVDRQKPAELERILPIIEKYAKKEYQQFKITSLDRLYDSVQQKYPEFIKAMYSRGSEILVGNLPATKYNVFCQFLKTLKKRLTVDLQIPGDWDQFIAGIRKEHGRKKKLIQLLNIDEL